MASTYSALCVLAVLTVSGGCGLIDDAPDSGQNIQVPAGTVRDSGDWSCVADEIGHWDCQESNPEPAYVPELPTYDKHSGQLVASTQSAQVAKAHQAPEPQVEAEPVAQPEPQAEAEPQVESEPLALADAEAEAEAEPEPQVEPETPIASETTLIASAADAQPVALHSDNQAREAADNAYVLQLAAHHSLASAQTALTALDAPGAEIIKTRADSGEFFFVIIAGAYNSHSEALTAAADFQARNAGLDYWIRDAKGLVRAQ
jgi:hypothetical protein